ncbi:MAG: NAD(P)/FAD-dependent oxidoreductase [Myxococcota bacterium]
MRKHVVIVGGGFGGLKAAKALADLPVTITVVDRENHHLFQPLLYQVATAGLAPGSIAVPIRGALARQENVRVILGEATEVDRESRTLHLKDGGELAYDYLIVACGAKTNYFGNATWGDHAFGLKDIRDAIAVREKILLAFEAAEREEDAERRRRLLTFVVIGGGPTGVEMAGAISELGRQVLARDYRQITPDDIRVLLVERGPRVLSAFDEDLRLSAARQLDELGVELHLRTQVVDVDAQGVTLRPVEGEPTDEAIAASVVVWAAGVQPVSFAARLGVTLDSSGRIVVDESCATLADPNIFAIGDVAAFTPEGEGAALPGLAPVAIQQGSHVARVIQSDLRRRARPAFRYVDKGIMATIGRSRAVVQGSFKLDGFFAWIAWGLIHVLYLIGYRNRFIVMFNWFWSYVTFKRGARLITARSRRR